MLEEQLQYIRNQLANGVAENQIRIKLREANYDNGLIDELFQVIESERFSTNTVNGDHSTSQPILKEQIARRLNLLYYKAVLLIVLSQFVLWHSIRQLENSALNFFESFNLFANSSSSVVQFIIAVLVVFVIQTTVARSTNWKNKNEVTTFLITTVISIVIIALIYLH